MAAFKIKSSEPRHFSLSLLFRLLYQNSDSCIPGRTQTILLCKTHTYLILISFSLIISDIVLNLYEMLLSEHEPKVQGEGSCSYPNCARGWRQHQCLHPSHQQHSFGRARDFRTGQYQRGRHMTILWMYNQKPSRNNLCLIHL